MNKNVIAFFRVKPNPTKPHFYEVRIFDTKAAMVAHWHKRHESGYFTDKSTGSGVVRKFEAIASSSEKLEQWSDGRWRKTPWLGEVLFYKSFMGAGIVSHEMSHAGLYWLTRNKDTSKGFNLSRRDDEKLAEAVGELSRQFWVKWFKKFSTGHVPRAKGKVRK